MIGAGSYKKINEVKVDLKNEVIEKKYELLKTHMAKLHILKVFFQLYKIFF